MAGSVGGGSPTQLELPPWGAAADVDFGFAVGGECGEYDGKLTELTLRFLGAAAADIQVLRKKGELLFDGTVEPGTLFSLSGYDKRGTLGTTIDLYVDGALDTDIHTSCSRPIFVGLVAGSFEVVAGASRNGRAL